MKTPAESGVHLHASGGGGLGAGRPIVPVIILAAVADGECPFAGQLSRILAAQSLTFPQVHTWPINVLGLALLPVIRALIASVKAYASVRFTPKPAAHFVYISLLVLKSVIKLN